MINQKCVVYVRECVCVCAVRFVVSDTSYYQKLKTCEEDPRGEETLVCEALFAHV